MAVGDAAAAAASGPGAARERALARLSGMDMFRVFDLDGSGSIDRDVIMRSLRRFEPEVFTDEALAELFPATLVGAAVGDSPAAATILQASSGESCGKLRLQEFAKLLPTPRELPDELLKSAENHGAAMDAYMSNMVGDLKSFKEVIGPSVLESAAKASAEELATLRADLQIRAKEYMFDVQRKNIRPLWEQFDADRNGILSLEECGRLVAAYVTALLPRSADIIRGSIELGVEVSFMLCEVRVQDQTAISKMRAQAKAQVDAIHAVVAPRVKATLEKMQAQDPALVATDLLQGLDLNSDGQVTQEEFESRFVEAMQHVLGPDRMMEKAQQEN